MALSWADPNIFNQNRVDTNAPFVDPRVQILPTDARFSPIGKIKVVAEYLHDESDSPYLKKIISIKDESNCTATLIGPATVLTAAHCFLREEVPHRILPEPHSESRFVGMDAQTGANLESGIDSVRFGTEAKSWDPTQDWAVVSLKEPIGDYLGFYRVVPLSHEAANEEYPDYFIVGYFSDWLEGNSRALHAGCAFRGIGANGDLLHDCACMPGTSGAPIMQWGSRGVPEIVAINVGYFSVFGNSIVGRPFSVQRANRAVFLPSLQSLMTLD